MGLRAQATTDLAEILEDEDAGFGWPITVTDPDETSAELVGFASDVAQEVETETGLVVSGRTSSVAIRIGALTAAGLGLPRGVPDEDAKPWVVAFADSEGTEHTFKVREGRPDLALGIVVCLLEAYEP